jgi:ELWxxDGT repeat protein
MPVVVNNVMYFPANDGSGSELWRTDGVDNTDAHTFKVVDINGGAGSSNVLNLFNLNGTLSTLDSHSHAVTTGYAFSKWCWRCSPSTTRI